MPTSGTFWLYTAAATASGALTSWLIRLGGLGLIGVGLVDASVIPTPGGMDVLTIVLAASNRNWWFYYTLMATLGAVLGAWVSFRIGRKGGKEALDKKFSKKRTEKLYRTFEKYGFLTVFLGALMPPPVPTVAFVMTAGALKYPTRRFLVAMTSGRFIRYTLIGYFASRYGKQILGFLNAYKTPVLAVFLVFAIGGGIFAFVTYRKARRKEKAERTAPQAA